ncbi:MAG: DUF4292 domain-containing protein [Tannerellaceae bacterium]|jgi:hypothetical protein|nr:DUF4292 domain-containing protein [Tannerellaceae bacterium]
MQNKPHIRPQTISALSLLLLLLALAGCRTSRTVAVREANVSKEAEAFFFSVRKQAFHYRTLSARTRVELNLPGKELSSRVDIRMIKDSVFQLSVQPFAGIEVLRVEFGIDSVKVIDRMNRRYVLESYADLKEAVPVGFNFYNLQALFTNQIFIPGEREITPMQYGRFTLEQDRAATRARISDAMKLLYAFTADGEEKLLSTNVADPSDHYLLQWQYSDFRLMEEQTFPMHMEAKLLRDGTPAGEMNLTFSRIQRDVPVVASFPIPERYKRITWAEIIKGLGS